ncbi:hypothetical protein J437_LFUL019096 [Ladona fulva]|uniref:HTH CENPB-type domain-containing protein n=1 Tax=Ladona fulva TaxID=123851 RepID=A0A8K0KT84_LADFU|nr:hypothetical protein J437_LFUL019096 [Ladona fulva]
MCCQLIPSYRSWNNTIKVRKYPSLPESTIWESEISLKKREKIEEFVSKSDSSSCIANRKTLKGPTFQELDLLAKWFLQKRAEGVPISGHMCTSQAQRFWELLKLPDAIYAVARAWSNVKNENTKKEQGFNKVNAENSLSSPAIVAALQDIVGLEGIEKSEIVSWEQCDQNDLGCDVLTDEEMAKEVIEKHGESSAQVDEDEKNHECDENAVRLVTHREAGEAIEIVLNYFEQPFN